MAMHTIADVAKALPIIPSASTPHTTPVNTTMATDLPAEWLRRIWERMVAMFGHRWASTHGVSPQDQHGALTIAGSTWAKGLRGLTGQQLGHGLEACVFETDEWPPVLAKFRAMCFRIPSSGAVWRELHATDTQRSAFVRLVWQRIDGYAWRMADDRRREQLLSPAYEAAREHVMRGLPLPEAPAGELEHVASPVVASSPEVAREHLAAIDGILTAGALP